MYESDSVSESALSIYFRTLSLTQTFRSRLATLSNKSDSAGHQIKKNEVCKADQLLPYILSLRGKGRRREGEQRRGSRWEESRIFSKYNVKFWEPINSLLMS